jgi:DNA-binding MltR family transcriptional regulator
MGEIPNKVSDRLFGSYGPLYELSPKADIAYAFGLIDSRTLADLRTVRDIRNIFAHAADSLHFKSQDILGKCRKLSQWKDGTDGHEVFDKTIIYCISKISTKIQGIIFKPVLQEIASSNKS